MRGRMSTTRYWVEISLLGGKLSHLIGKTNSTVPDSLGDRLFRAKLKLSWLVMKADGNPIPEDHINHIHDLFNEYETSRNPL